MSDAENLFTIRELKKMASEAGIKNYGYMRKNELIDVLGMNDDFSCSKNNYDVLGWILRIIGWGIVFILYLIIFEAFILLISCLFAYCSTWVMDFIVVIFAQPLKWVHLLGPDWHISIFFQGLKDRVYLCLSIFFLVALNLSSLIDSIQSANEAGKIDGEEAEPALGEAPLTNKA